MGNSCVVSIDGVDHLVPRGGSLTLGSADSADVQVDDPRVQGVHARIEDIDDDFLFVDDSGDGSFLGDTGRSIQGGSYLLPGGTTVMRLAADDGPRLTIGVSRGIVASGTSSLAAPPPLMPPLDSPSIPAPAPLPPQDPVPSVSPPTPPLPPQDPVEPLPSTAPPPSPPPPPPSPPASAVAAPPHPQAASPPPPPPPPGDGWAAPGPVAPTYGGPVTVGASRPWWKQPAVIVVIGVLGLVAAAIGYAVVQTSGTTSAQDIAEGRCYEEPSGEFTRLREQDCSGVHDLEIILIVTMPPGPFPSEAEFEDRVVESCGAEFDTINWEALPLDADGGWFEPNRAGWEVGDHDLACHVYSDTGLVGPVVRLDG